MMDSLINSMDDLCISDSNINKLCDTMEKIDLNEHDIDMLCDKLSKCDLNKINKKVIERLKHIIIFKIGLCGNNLNNNIPRFVY